MVKTWINIELIFQHTSAFTQYKIRFEFTSLIKIEISSVKNLLLIDHKIARGH